MKEKIEKKETMKKDKLKITKTKKTTAKPKVSTTNFDNVQGKFLLVRVGNQDDPAGQAEIDAIRDQLIDLFEKNNVDCLALVTHHAVSIDVIGNDFFN